MARPRFGAPQFPVEMFLQQFNKACGSISEIRDVTVRALRSKKHATVEIEMPDFARDDGPRLTEAIIAKYFADNDKARLNQERNVYLAAKSEPIQFPRLIIALNNFLVFEKIEGRTLMDLINDDNESLPLKREQIAKLGKWLSTFHIAFKSNPHARRRGDSNLRNFISTNTGEIVGVDFEEANTEIPITDLYEVIDSILLSDPGIYSVPVKDLSWKFELCMILIRTHGEQVDCASMQRIYHDLSFNDGLFSVMRRLADIRGIRDKLEALLPEIEAHFTEICKTIDFDQRLVKKP